MTINVSRVLSPDLYAENDSLLLKRTYAGQHSNSVPPLGAITCIAVKADPSQKLQDLALACAKEAFSLVTASHNDRLRCWLFVSDGPWKEATRIVVHQKLWKNHRDLFEADAGCIKSEEVEIKAGSKVRYAGLIEISSVLVEKAIESVRVCSSLAIIFSRRSDIVLPMSVEQIFRSAFSMQNGLEQTSIDWKALAVALCPKGDLLLRVSGLFDDHEAAVDIIASPQNLPAVDEVEGI